MNRHEDNFVPFGGVHSANKEPTLGPGLPAHFGSVRHFLSTTWLLDEDPHARVVGLVERPRYELEAVFGRNGGGCPQLGLPYAMFPDDVDITIHMFGTGKETPKVGDVSSSDDGVLLRCKGRRPVRSRIVRAIRVVPVALGRWSGGALLRNLESQGDA